MSLTTELLQAIELHDSKRIAVLLALGADPNAYQSDWPHYTALQSAVNELEDGGPIEALALLLKHGADVNGWDINRAATPLLMATFRGQPAAVQMLLDAGADPNVEDNEGDSPLRWCADHDDIDTATKLLKHGADRTIDRPGGTCGCSSLGIAAARLNVAMIELLIDFGADPHARDSDGKTARERLPLLDSSNEKSWETAASLLQS